MTFARHRLRNAASLLPAAIASLTLAGCGGGGGGGGNAAPPPPPPPPPPPNTAPTADAGMDQSVNESSTVQLAGAGADADGDTLSYQWSQVSGPTVTFDDATNPTTSVSIGTVAIETTETIELSLEVSDGRGGTATDTVSLDVASTDFVFLFASDNSSVDKYDPETNIITWLTNDGNVDPFVIDFAFSPDGQWIAYRGADRAAASLKVELYVGSTNGGGASVVSGPIQADGDVAEFQWSPDSQRLVYLADAETDQVREIYVVDRDGANFAKLNTDLGPTPSVFLEELNWSADGQYVAYFASDMNTGDIIGVDVTDVSTTLPNSTRVSTLSAQETAVGNYEWAPVGNRLYYFVTGPANSNVINLYTVAGDGTGNVSVLDPMRQPDTRLRNFRWSPDGSLLAYMADQDTANVSELYVAAADGSSNVRASLPLPMGAEVFDTFNRWAWAPDGSRLAYLANPNGGFELFSVNPDGTDNVTVNGPLVPGSVNLFSWSPDSARLTYRANQDDPNLEEIYVSRVDGSENMKLNPPLSGNNPTTATWSPDSTRLTYSAQLAGSPDIGNYTVRVDGSENLRIDDATSMDTLVNPAVWSADGSRLLYIVRRASGITNYQIATVDGVMQETVPPNLIREAGWVAPTGN